MNKALKKYYVSNRRRIERELGIKYTGSTEQELKDFVLSHVRQLPIIKDKKKIPHKEKVVYAPAKTKPAGMFRKHGSGQKFQSENT